MNRRFAAALVIVAAGWGCSRADYVPDGPLQKPLTTFERIDVRALQNKVAPTTGDAPALSPDKFIQLFRKDLTARLHRRKAYNLSSGPMLIVEGSVLRYQCESRPPAYAKDNLTNKANIEVDIVLSDETGARAETRIIRAIAAYLRKSAKGADTDPDD